MTLTSQLAASSKDRLITFDNFLFGTRWKAQLQDFKDRADELVEHFVSFNMPVPPRFDGLSVIELEITMSSTSWSLLRDYLSELDLLEKQDWISFRGNMHLLHDLAMSWSDKVKERIVAGQADAVMLHLSSQLERIKAAATTLKYCHGKDFKDEHWSALLQGKLGLGKEIRLESLTVGHFVAALDKVLEPALLVFVKELQAQAQGEVLVRDALQELSVWSQTAELSLVEYKEQGRKTMLVKDWGRMFLDLGDKQSLLSSLKESQFYRAFESIGKWSNIAYAIPHTIANSGASYETKMSNLDFVLHALNTVQRKWVYLEPIFARGGLPNESKRFRGVDEDFREIMCLVEVDQKLFSTAFLEWALWFHASIIRASQVQSG